MSKYDEGDLTCMACIGGILGLLVGAFLPADHVVNIDPVEIQEFVDISCESDSNSINIKQGATTERKYTVKVYCDGTLVTKGFHLDIK